MNILTEPGNLAENLLLIAVDDARGQNRAVLEMVFEAAKRYDQLPARYWADVVEALHTRGWKP